VAGTAITLFLTFFIGNRLFSAKAGLWAEAILATNLLMIVVGSSAVVDGVLLPFIVGAMAVFVSRAGKTIRIIDVISCGALMGLGMLAKGPMGLAPVPVMAVCLWFGRKDRTGLVGNLAKVGLMMIAAIGIFMAWAIPANKAMGGELLRVFGGQNILARTFEPMESHGGNFFLYLPYYPAVMIAGFFPWALFLPGSFSAVIGKRIGTGNSRNILMSWIAVTVILMTLAATKLPHYMLFVWPAIAIMAGGTIAAGENVLNERDKKWLRGGAWFLGPVGLSIGAGLIVAGYLLRKEGLQAPGTICGLEILVMTVICCILQIRERFTVSAGATLAGVLVLIAPLLFGLLPGIEAVKISPSIAGAIKEKTGKDVPVAMYEYAEPSLIFYTGRKIKRLRREAEAIEWLKTAGQRVLIIPRKDYDDIRQKSGAAGFEEIVSKKGINYSKGTSVEVIAIMRKEQGAQ
jgi:4-amino-4-deoxy-L-arabinose transferase-like glycosyltransferase